MTGIAIGGESQKSIVCIQQSTKMSGFETQCVLIKLFIPFIKSTFDCIDCNAKEIYNLTQTKFHA